MIMFIVTISGYVFLLLLSILFSSTYLCFLAMQNSSNDIYHIYVYIYQIYTYICIYLINEQDIRKNILKVHLGDGYCFIH